MPSKTGPAPAEKPAGGAAAAPAAAPAAAAAAPAPRRERRVKSPPFRLKLNGGLFAVFDDEEGFSRQFGGYAGARRWEEAVNTEVTNLEEADKNLEILFMQMINMTSVQLQEKARSMGINSGEIDKALAAKPPFHPKGQLGELIYRKTYNMPIPGISE